MRWHDSGTQELFLTAKVTLRMPADLKKLTLREAISGEMTLKTWRFFQNHGLGLTRTSMNCEYIEAPSVLRRTCIIISQS